MGGGEGIRRDLQQALAAAAIALLTLAIWFPGIDGPYHFDDYVTPLQDPASQALSAWLYWLPDTLRPLTKLTYAFEGSFGGDVAAELRRLPGVLFHAATAVGLYLLILSWFDSRPLPAVVLTLIWALHPVHAQSVLAVHGRSTALVNLLLVAAVLAYIRDRTWTAGILLALAGLAKETALAGILPLLVLETSAANRSASGHARRLLPCVLAVLFLLCWYLSTPRYVSLAGYSLHGRPWFESVVRQVAAIPAGISLYFNPSALSIDYGIALPVSPATPLFLLGLLLYALALAGIVVTLKGAPGVAVGLALWLASLLPTQSLIPKLDPLTDRPLTLALAGLLIASAQPLSKLVRLSKPVLVFSVAFAGLASWLALATLHRGSLYESPLLLWSDAASKSVANSRPHLNYALLLGMAGRVDEADSALAEAVRIEPLDPRGRLVARLLSERRRERKDL
jgi:protein O-mannosyl-transferase